MLRFYCTCVQGVKYTQGEIVNVTLIISNQEPSLSEQAETAHNCTDVSLIAVVSVIWYFTLQNIHIRFIVSEKQLILNYGRLVAHDFCKH